MYPFSCQGMGNRQTNADTATGDYGDFILEFQIHFSLSSFCLRQFYLSFDHSGKRARNEALAITDK
jgi:hypothetical protein